MKKLVINKTQRVIMVPGLGNFLPGSNEYDPADLKKDQHVKQMFEDKLEAGDLYEPKADIDDDLSDYTLGQYNATDAKALVKETMDYDTLMKYRTEEIAGKARKGVIEALDAQIKKSEDALKKPKE